MLIVSTTLNMQKLLGMTTSQSTCAVEDSRVSLAANLVATFTKALES
jgi:hypothetical protein